MLAWQVAKVQYIDRGPYQRGEYELELRHFRYFRAVAEELHVTRAAARLGMAQPPLTQQIRALETEMGVALFRRVGRRVALTEAGEAFLEDVRAILGQVDAAVVRAKRVSRGEAGRLHLGFTESASFSPAVTGLLATFRARWPDIALTLTEGHTTVLIGKLRGGELDGAFVRPPVPDAAGLAFLRLATEALLAAVPVGHRLAARHEVALGELAEEAFVLYPRDASPGLSDAVVAACLRAGFMPRVAQQAPQLSSTVNFVAASLGVAVVPACMRHLRPESVRFLRLLGEQPSAVLGIATREADPAPALGNLRRLAEGVCLEASMA